MREHGAITREPESTPSTKSAKPAKPGKPAPAKPGKEPPKLFDTVLSDAEIATFTQALRELCELADSGIWYLGLDTDPDTPDKDGNPGVPIWRMTEGEAKRVANSFVALGKTRPEVYKAIRALNDAHAHLQAGLILGSRFFETGMRLFQTGINFRISKWGWTQSIQKPQGVN